MAFKILFVPPKKVSLPNDLCHPDSLMMNESSRMKNKAVVRSGPQSKHVLRETLLPWKKLLETDVMKWGKFFERGKNIGMSQSP